MNQPFIFLLNALSCFSYGRCLMKSLMCVLGDNVPIALNMKEWKCVTLIWYLNNKYQKKYEKLILYVDTIVNHNIWKTRNKIFHENEKFDIYKLISKISASLCARRAIENTENRLTASKKVEFLHEYLVAFCSIKDAMFDPG